MNSIKTKLILLVFGSMFGLFALMSYVGIRSINRTIEDDFATTMSILVEDQTQSLNASFNRVERGVYMLAKRIRENVDREKLKSDPAYREEFYEDLTEKCAAAGAITGNLVSVYFRPDPEVYGSTSGIFMTDNGNGELVNVVPTDILRYSKSEREYVGWYYEPVESGESLWMKPYQNKNIDVYIISYVVPIYLDSELLGVVGMDIKMSELISIIDSVDYKKGFAFLSDSDGDILYHRDYPDGLSMDKFNTELRDAAKYFTPQMTKSSEVNKFKYKGVKHRIISKTLDNGMMVSVCVPEEEVLRNEKNMQIQMPLLFVLNIVAVLAILWQLMVTIVMPINELTVISSRIAKGELNTSINYRSKDEIGKLAKSINMMALEIKDYFSYIHSQAYTDAMTGVGNKASYMDVVKVMDRKISEGMAAFIVIVFDVNGLKNVNDNYGHEYGDMLITDTADIMKTYFQQRMYIESAEMSLSLS